MGAYQRKTAKGLKWRYVGSHMGVKYCSKSLYDFKREAVKAEREEVERINNRLKNRGSIELTLRAAMESRLDDLVAMRSERYYIDTKRYFKALLDEIGDMNIGEITKKQINDLYRKEAERLKKKKKTNHKLREMQRVIHAFFERTIKVYGLEMKNPAHGLELYPVEITLKHIPTEEEINEVRSQLDHEELLLFDFVLETGCRINEAIRFFNKPEIHNDRLIVLWTRKAKNSTLTPRHIKKPECLPDNFIGITRWTDRPRFLEDITKGKWNWHNLRHRWATMEANNGIPIIQIMANLGHNNLTTTQGYLRSLGIIAQ